MPHSELHIPNEAKRITDICIEEIDYEEIGRKLLELGNGRITKYGNLYTNSDLEYYEPCTRESLSPFQFYDKQPVCVELKYQGNTNYVHLPDISMALERAACRMGASNLSVCECSIEYTEFNASHSEECNSVELQSTKLHKILEDICRNEGIEKLNMTAKELVRLDNTHLTHIVPVIEYAGDSSSDAIAKLVENIEVFAVYGDVSITYDLGLALINENTDYILNPDIEDYFDYTKYGEDMDLEWDDKYLDENIYVAIKDGIKLEQILEDDEVEEQNIQM